MTPTTNNAGPVDNSKSLRLRRQSRRRQRRLISWGCRGGPCGWTHDSSGIGRVALSSAGGSAPGGVSPRAVGGNTLLYLGQSGHAKHARLDSAGSRF